MGILTIKVGGEGKLRLRLVVLRVENSNKFENKCLDGWNKQLTYKFKPLEKVD